MSKGLYIGNNNAKKISKLYFGNGTSHKVKKGYIGVNGAAKLFFSGASVWNKYNTVTTYRYYWDRYNVNEVTKYKWNMLELITETGVQKDIGNIEIERTRDIVCYLINNINSIDDNSFILNGKEKSFNNLNNGDVFAFEANEPRIAYSVTDSPSRVPGSAINYVIKADQYSMQIINYSGNFIATVESTNRSDYPTNAPQDGYWYQYTGSSTEYHKGTHIDQVNSTDRSAYPDDDKSGDYWYVYDRQTTSYSQGSYIGTVESDNPSAYPTNGRHTDGYWYVLQPE